MSFRNIFKPNTPENTALATSIKQVVGYTPKKLYYYIKAFTHGSTNQKDSFGNSISYERLEYVGDAILSAVIAHYLFEKVIEGDEGYLTKMRSKIVSREHLNEIGKELGLSSFMRTKIPISQFGDNIHGNLLESLIGAVFLDKGYAACEKFIYKRLITPHVDIDLLEGKVISYKSLIIEWCQKEKKHFNFESLKDAGQDILKHFSVKLLIDGKTIAKARATSKKKAEEKVSKRAYFVLQGKIDKTS
ncbi:putative dsRNA-binding protein [Flavobacteriaceae bacterium]|nr:putative dsRNA-binding protein [Flavobacteriaceae bacterium]MDB9955091.1 putative dsRNA-binding protein [Flavobacteriaceae bacterium]MDC1265683.1 putative dsRNA-binding protein [Flavobacteriaceae bacterium]